MRAPNRPSHCTTQTVASYRQTVLPGFQEVEDNLAALRVLEQEAVVQDEAVALARQSLQLTLNQVQIRDRELSQCTDGADHAARR